MILTPVFDITEPAFLNLVTAQGMVLTPVPSPDVSGSLGLVTTSPAVIIGTTPLKLGENFTVTVANKDLTTVDSIAATVAGISIGSPSNITKSTVDFTLLAGNLQVGVQHPVVLSITE